MKVSSLKIIRNLIADKNLNESVWNSQILIPSFPLLSEKIANFPKKFQIITDFDFTITRYNYLNHSISTINMIIVPFN